MKVEADKIAKVMNEELSEEAHKQRLGWAEEAKKRSVRVVQTCNTNNNGKKDIVPVSYKSGQTLERIMKEFAEVSCQVGKIEYTVKELNDSREE